MSRIFYMSGPLTQSLLVKQGGTEMPGTGFPAHWAPRGRRDPQLISQVPDELVFPDAVTAGAMGPGGRQIVLGTADGRVVVWSITDGAPVRKFVTPMRNSVALVRFSADEKALAALDDQGNLYWRLESWEPDDWGWLNLDAIQRQSTDNSEGYGYIPPDSLAFSMDGGYLATGGGSVWVVEIGQESQLILEAEPGPWTQLEVTIELDERFRSTYGGRSNFVAVGISSDNWTVRAANGEGMWSWNRENRECKPPIPSNVGADVAVISDDASLICWPNGSKVYVWSAVEDRLLCQPNVFERDIHVQALALSRDGERLAVASDGGDLVVIDVYSGVRTNSARAQGGVFSIDTDRRGENLLVTSQVDGKSDDVRARGFDVYRLR